MAMLHAETLKYQWKSYVLITMIQNHRKNRIKMILLHAKALMEIICFYYNVANTLIDTMKQIFPYKTLKTRMTITIVPAETLKKHLTSYVFTTVLPNKLHIQYNIRIFKQHIKKNYGNYNVACNNIETNV